MLALIPFMAFSQPDKAGDQVRKLKSSMLLVRLMTSENKINALKESGHEDKAKQVEAKQREENLAIAKAFSENFDFCPVYFFYSTSSKEVRQMHLQGNLMNENLEPVAGIARPVPFFFVAEFGNIERTDEKYLDDYTFRQNEEGKKEVTPTYYGSTDMGFSALIVRDMDFVQLREPFPFYVRTYASLPIFKRKKSKSVAKLNTNLKEFYRLNQKK